MAVWRDGGEMSYLYGENGLTPEQAQQAVNSLTYDGLQIAAASFFLIAQKVDCRQDRRPKFLKAEKQMKVYIAGKITGLEKPDFLKKFYDSSKALRDQGHLTMSPATLALNEGFSHADYLHVCFAMIDVCDAVFLQKDWRDSEGARQELDYAKTTKKQIIFEEFEEQESRES